MRAAIVVAALCLGACASYRHPTKTAADFERDKYDCERETLLRSSHWLTDIGEMERCLVIKHGWCPEGQQCLTAPPAPPGPPPLPSAGFQPIADRFSGEEGTRAIIDAGQIAIGVAASAKAGEVRASIEVYASSGRERFQRCAEMWMLVDGTPMRPADPEYVPPPGSLAVEATLDGEQIEALLRAKSVELRACRDEVRLDAADLRAIRAAIAGARSAAERQRR